MYIYICIYIYMYIYIYIDVLCQKKMMLLIYVYIIYIDRIFIYNRNHTQLGIVGYWVFSHNSPYSAALCPCHPCHFVTMTDPPRGASLAVETSYVHYPCWHGLPRNFRWSKHVFQHLPQDFGFSLPHLIQVKKNRPQVHCLGWRAVM